MLIVGIDCGNEYTKAVLLQNGNVIAKAVVPTDFDINLAAKTALENLLSSAGVEAADGIAVTGAGRDAVDFADEVINGVMSAAMGAYVADLTVEMVIDLGAEGYRAISVKDEGSVGHYEGNDRCAAGSGTFVETMARALQVGIADMSDLAMQHTEDLAIASQCVVFAESEVVSLIHAKQTVENIAFGVIAGVANRVATVAKREGIKDRTMFIGGLSTNEAMVYSLSREIGKDLIVPEDPQYTSAIGAATLLANRRQ